MIYVFVFQGEFGFELLNWQGVVRKFATTIAPEDKIICCSRANLYSLYEMADEFVDISEVPLFKQSRASAYWGIFSPAELPRYRLIGQFKEKSLKLLLRHQLKQFIWKNSQILQGNLNQPVRFILSARPTRINSCLFGWSRNDGVMDIYDLLDVENNLYRKIEPDLSWRSVIEERLKFSLDEPFLLIQTRKRDTSTKQPSPDLLETESLIEHLSRQVKIVLLSFDTGRWLDSHSDFPEKNIGYHYRCTSFPEQACLIYYARHCLFLTEGDFGSHIYVPPMMGKDVTVVAPRSIFQLESTPIDFWNQKVFTCGGQVVAAIAESVLSSDESLNQFSSHLLSKYLEISSVEETKSSL
ncbi:MAG: hypothetical protein SAL07_16650 [Oscillatoria sp. PMC 1051.18]|nr:hypothetical protein [Oscillatoria sp. PMC 1051.18]